VAEQRGLVVDAADEIAALVKALGDELGVFRQRAIKAEARVRELEAAGGSDLVDLSKRITELERENVDLTGKIAAATERTEELLERIRFTRQQQESAGETR
jgi:hypothetical protein